MLFKILLIFLQSMCQSMNWQQFCQSVTKSARGEHPTSDTLPLHTLYYIQKGLFLLAIHHFDHFGNNLLQQLWVVT